MFTLLKKKFLFNFFPLCLGHIKTSNFTFCAIQYCARFETGDSIAVTINQSLLFIHKIEKKNFLINFSFQCLGHLKT